MSDDPDIAAVLEADKREIAALLRGDASFEDFIAEDCIVHNPANRVAKRADVIGFYRAGLISYSSFERRIEHTGRLGERVVVMGEEIMVPKDNAPNAGKTVRRRFTDIWGKHGETWKLDLRHATIISVE